MRATDRHAPELFVVVCPKTGWQFTAGINSVGVLTHPTYRPLTIRELHGVVCMRGPARDCDGAIPCPTTPTTRNADWIPAAVLAAHLAGLT